MERRVVITGLGAVTPLGNSMEETWIKLLDGSSGIGWVTRFDVSAFPCRIAGEVKGFDPLRFMTAKEAHKTDPFIKYALAAALMATEDARLSLTPNSELCGNGTPNSQLYPLPSMKSCHKSNLILPEKFFFVGRGQKKFHPMWRDGWQGKE